MTDVRLKRGDPARMQPEKLATLRTILDDGEWHDEQELVDAILPLVAAGIGLRHYQRDRMRKPWRDRYTAEQAEQIGKREYVLALLRKVNAQVQVVRRYRRGAPTLSNRSAHLDQAVYKVLADHQWHPIHELLEAAHIRPEVAMRKYLSYIKNRPDKRATRAEQLALGTKTYMSQIISRMRHRQGFKIEARGFRKGMEYRLVD